MIKVIRRDSDEAVEFTPHLAMTHMEFNGGAANGENSPISMKSKVKNFLSKEALAAIEKIEGKEAAVKASMQNIRNRLEVAIESKIRDNVNTDYVWVWVRDFDDEKVVFEFNNSDYSLDYSIDESMTITLGDTMVEVVVADNYTTVEGGEPIFKGSEKGTNMSQVELTQEELDAKIAKAQEEALEQYKAQKAAEELTASVKGAIADLPFVVKAVEDEKLDVDSVVKSLVSLDDAGVAVLKALENAGAAIIAAEKARDEAVSEKESIKDKFSEQTSVEVDGSEASTKGADEGAKMADAVARLKAKRAQKAQ